MKKWILTIALCLCSVCILYLFDAYAGTSESSMAVDPQVQAAAVQGNDPAEGDDSEEEEDSSADASQIDAWTHLKRQEAAAQAYNDLFSNFPLVYNEAYDESDYAYDEDYGGAYVNDEDYLVVCVKGLSEESESKYYGYCGSEDVFLTDVVFSYAELKEISRKLRGLYGEKCVIRINVKENRVDLYVSPGTTLPEDLAGAPVCVTEVAVDTQEDRDKVFAEYFFQD